MVSRESEQPHSIEQYRDLSDAIDSFIASQIEVMLRGAQARKLDRPRLTHVFCSRGFSTEEFGLDVSVPGEEELLLSLRMAHAEIRLIIDVLARSSCKQEASRPTG
jgi:hypothetical protein